MKHNKYTFFLKWLVQTDGRITAQQANLMGLGLLTVGLLIKSSVLSQASAAFLLINYTSSRWMEYRNRQAWEGWQKGHAFKKT